MFDIGWTELAVVALIALVVIGPKDLPKAMRTVGQYARKLRGMAREFQSGLDDLAREAELDEAKKAIQSVSNPKKTFTDAIDPTGEMEKDMRELDKDARDQMREVNEAGAKDKDEGSSGATKAKVVDTPTQSAPGNSVKPPKPAAQDTSATPKDTPASNEKQSKSA